MWYNIFVHVLNRNCDCFPICDSRWPKGELFPILACVCRLCLFSKQKKNLKAELENTELTLGKESSFPLVNMNRKLENNHDFNWKHVKILDREPSYNRRLISEIVYMKKAKDIVKQTKRDGSSTRFLLTYPS